MQFVQYQENNVSKTEMKYDMFERTIYDQIELFSRKEARYIANGIALCINDNLIKDTSIVHDFVSEGDVYRLQEVTFECGFAHRSGGATGDFFVVDLYSNTFVYDGSEDSMKGGEFRSLSVESECWMHSNKAYCEKAIDEMHKKLNTDETTRAFWKFDDSIEWLEWVIVPDTHKGYLGILGKGGLDKEENLQLLVVVGTQKDEVENSFKEIKQVSSLIKNEISVDSSNYKKLIITLVVLLLVNTTISIYLTVKKIRQP